VQSYEQNTWRAFTEHHGAQQNNAIILFAGSRDTCGAGIIGVSCAAHLARLPQLLLGVRELGLTAKASCREVARHLHRVKFDVASYTNDRRATVEFSKKVAGAMARHAARIAYERAGGR
jgi:hypothetical protein